MSMNLGGQDRQDSVDDFLAHYGVKGMRWGKRKASALRRGHQLNKASRRKDSAQRKADLKKATAERDSEIDGARARDGKPNRARYKAAKSQYKQDKVEIGRREAKKALHKVRDEIYDDMIKARESKSGRETTNDILEEVRLVKLAQMEQG